MPETILGLKDLERKLGNLDIKQQRRAIRNAANASMLPVLKAARGLIPVGTEPHTTYRGRLVAPGFAKRNLARKSFMSRDGSRFVALAGVKPEAFYALQFIELGTSKIPARPWLEPSYRVSRRQVQALFTKKLKEQILKQARKK